MTAKLQNLTSRALAEVQKRQPHVNSDPQIAFEYEVFVSIADLADSLGDIHTQIILGRKDMIELKTAIERLRVEELG